MVKFLLDRVMERRAGELTAQFRDWLPADGSVLDVGSGTGHIAAHLERDQRLQVVTADVCDIHVVGPAPVLIDDGVLPFEERRFAAALLIFMLAYPNDPAEVLAETARVTRGPIILVQTLYASRIGYACFRAREFCWTFVAFHLSKLIGYVGSNVKFSMKTKRFYTLAALERDIARAGLRVQARRQRPLLSGGSLSVATWMLERND